MGFHEIRFPTAISRAAVSGPSTLTDIIEVDSGAEEAVARYNTPRLRADARQGIKKLSDLQAVMGFYRARNGPANGFRYKDWLDYATNSTGDVWTAAGAADPVSATDVQIGVGDNSETQFQLKKEYVSGSQTSVRNLTKIVNGTVKVSLDDVEQTEGVDYTVNYNTGIVTFTAAPGVGVIVKAGCEFDAPMRFTQAIDVDGLLASVEGFDMGNIPSIPMIEVVSGLEVHNAIPLLGATDFDGSANFTVTLQDGSVITVNPTAAGVKMIVPGTKDNLSTGGVYWYVSNRHGSNSFEIRDGTAGGTLIATVAAGATKIVCLGVDSGGTKTWYAF